MSECCIISIIIIVGLVAALVIWLWNMNNKSIFNCCRQPSADNQDFKTDLEGNFKVFMDVIKVREQGNYRLYFYKPRDNDFISFELIRRDVEMGDKILHEKYEMDYKLCKEGTYKDKCVIYYKFRYSEDDYCFIVNTKRKTATLIINDSDITIFNKRISIESADTFRLL